jgi:hypothetical protein
MQLRSLCRRLLPRLALAVLLVPFPTSADVDEQEAGYRFELFTDSDDVHVLSNIGGYEITLAGGSRISVGWNHERVVIPGVAAPPGSEEAVDSVSGASRPISSSEDPFSDYTKVRNQLDSTVRHGGLSAGYYLSSETDYFAQQVSGGLERRFFGDHLLLALGISFGWDRIEPLDDDDTNAAADRKTTLHGNVVATQVVTPTTVAQIGLEWNEVQGLQHNPYRTVYVAGGYLPEVHPDSRTRRDAFLKISQYLANRSSVKLSYKYYSDDWGIDSHTIGAKLNQYVGDNVVLRHRYRFYAQAEADFFQDDYDEPGGVSGFRTGDYRMSDFTAHLFGTKLSWNLGRSPFAIPALDGIRMNLKYERYFNSNNFSANIFESGLAVSF